MVLPFVRGNSIPLPSVLKPVAHLLQSQASLFSDQALLLRSRVAILLVALLQQLSRFLLEAVHGLLAVPDCPWQRILPSYPVFVYSPQLSASELFSLAVMRLVPHIL